MRKTLSAILYGNSKLFNDIGLLLLRISLGGLMVGLHGAGKFAKLFSWFTGDAAGKEFVSTFPDPLGVGNTFSAISAVGAEFFASILLVLGLATRVNAVALAFTMFVASALVHQNPFKDGELAFVYLVGFVALALMGGGRFSLDEQVVRRVV